ncbi:MAG: exodeoxyribonuclease VII small subunit [Clostridia bacterium]|nr:exodeoxyribonuclease VII small subunit [Clostridia bacterium]
MPEKKLSFEEAMKRLEEVVRQLETGNAPLSDSLALFEEGVALVRRCNDELTAAEKKIKDLSADENA